MAEPTAICGNRCDACPAHWNNVETFGRERIADGWLRYHGLEVSPAQVGCQGCSSAGGEPTHPDCPVRSCAHGRGLSSCSDCRDASCDSMMTAQTIFERARQA